VIALNGRTRIALVLTILAIVLEGSAISDWRVTRATSTGWKIDAFTVKDPYNGIGANESSDTFSPEENIQIYAKLTYNDFPISQRLISFQLTGPPNPERNVTQVYTGLTNSSGLASTPALSETTFGEWTVLTSAQVTSEILVNDSLTFMLGWILNFTSLRTVNESFQEQTQFAKGATMGVEIGLLNIAMTEKNVTLSISALDSLGFEVNSTRINVIVPSSEAPAVHHIFMQIPANANVGSAILYANAYKTTYDSGRVPYCPQITRSFTIGTRNLSILQITPSSQKAYKNETLSINVLVANTGDASESFNVTIYGNETTIDQIAIFDLMPSASAVVSFVWHTGETTVGRYLIKAALTTSAGEDPSDNIFTDGFVEIVERVHDIQVLNVTPSVFTTYAGILVDIRVTLKNVGTESETVDVVLYSDDTIIGTWNVNSLVSLEERTIVFNWDTANAPVGDHVISAYAVPVQREQKVDDNTFVDGHITILAPAQQYAPNNWIYWMLAFLALLFLIILVSAILLLSRRRKRNREKNEFISGWTAWYYCQRLSKTSEFAKESRNPKRTN